MASISDIKKIAYRDFELKNLKFHYKAYRSIAVYVVYLLHFFGTTANMGSLYAIIITLISGFFVLTGSVIGFFLMVLFLYISEMLDYADGMMARLRKKEKDCLGIFLDDYFHQIPRQFLFVFLGIGAYLSLGSKWYLLAGILCTVFQLLVMHISELRKTIISNFTDNKFFNEQDDNPLVKSNLQKLIFYLAIFPMKQIKLLLLGSAFISIFIPQFMYWLLIFYTPFLIVRFAVFFCQTYSSLKKLKVTSDID